MHAMNDDELPIFGLNSPLRPGERTPRQQIDDAVANNALATAFFDCRRRRRRGAPIRKWRKNLREPMRAVMEKHPDASDAEIARLLLETNVLKRANVIARTVHWLSTIRRGGIGYGRWRR
jgi:hypothetical protein